MPLTSSRYLAPVNVNFAFTNSAVNITGQAGFNAATGVGGSAFLHGWNNAGAVALNAFNFNENGYASSFNFATFLPMPSSALLGTYLIGNSIFRRSNPESRIVRSEGNRLMNVDATLTANIFQEGSYLDLYGNLSQIKFSGVNALEGLDNPHAASLYQGTCAPLEHSLLAQVEGRKALDTAVR